MTVLTDHSAIKAVLETSNPTGKHARWWTKVYGRGVKEVRITYKREERTLANHRSSCLASTAGLQQKLRFHQSLSPVSVADYRKELVLFLSSAQELAQRSIRKAQAQYKTQYDKKSMEPNYKIGKWVLVWFPQEKSGHNRKLSRPWHGPYQIIERMDSNLIVAKVYFPTERTICSHQTCVCKCPLHFPAGYYWYGG